MKINYKFKEIPENWFKYLPKIQKKDRIKIAYSTELGLFSIFLNDVELDLDFLGLITGSVEKGSNGTYFKLTAHFLEKFNNLSSLGYTDHIWSHTDYLGWAIDVDPETFSDKALKLRKYLQS